MSRLQTGMSRSKAEGRFCRRDANIWKTFPNVKISVQAIFVSEVSRVATCEIVVYLGGEDAKNSGNVLRVVDVLSFGEAQRDFGYPSL